MPPTVQRGPLHERYRGTIFTIFEQEIRFPNGVTKTYEFCERPDSVSILAFDAQGRLLLIRERRAGYKHNVWFLPGGRIDKKGESPRRSALRELQEEAGFTAKHIKLLYKKSPSNTLRWNIYIFVAKDLTPAKLEGDEEFPITVVPTPLVKAVRMAKDGTIENEFIAYSIIRFYEMQKKGEFHW